MSTTTWPISGLLFVAGGAASAVGAVIFTFASPAVGGPATIAGLIAEGVAFVLLGLGFRGRSLPAWAPWFFVGAGVVDVAYAILAIVGANLGTGGILFGMLAAGLVLAASISAFLTRAVEPPLRPVLLALGVWMALDLLLGVIDVGGWWALVVLGALFVATGVLLIRNPATTS